MNRIFLSPRILCLLLSAGALVGLSASTGCKVSSQRRGSARGDAPGATDNTRAYVENARELRNTGREDEALALLTRAIEANPTLTVAHLEMGDIFEQKGDFVAAERSFGNAAQHEPASFDAQFGHGRVLHALSRIAEAVRAYLRALSIRPDDFNANLGLATAYIQIDGPAQALPYAQRSAQIQPTSGAAHANLGSVYSALGRHREAVEEYQNAAELMELNPALLMNLAEALGKIERYQEMINTLTTANRIRPSAAAYERLGFAEFKLKHYDAAMDAFRSAISADADHYPALNGLGVCLLNRYIVSDKQDAPALSEAMGYLRQSLRVNSRQPRIVELIARYER